MYAAQVAKSVAICVIFSQILMVQAQTCQSPANAAAPPPGAEVINEFTVSGTLNYTCDAATKTYTLLGLEAEMLQDGKPPGMAYSAAVGSTLGGIYTLIEPATNKTLGSVSAAREDLATTENAKGPYSFVRAISDATGSFAGGEYIWRNGAVGESKIDGSKCTPGGSKVVKEPVTANYVVYKCAGAVVPSSSTVVKGSALLMALGAAFNLIA